MSPNLKFHTPANQQTCTEQTRESNRRFLDEPWWPVHCFRSSYLLSLPRFFVILGKFSFWHAVVQFRCHLSIPQRRDLTSIWRLSISQSLSGTGTSPFPSVRAARNDTVSVLLYLEMSGSTRKKRSLPVTLEV